MGTASTVATMGLGPVGTRQIAEAYSKDDARAVMVARRALFWGTMVLACAGGMPVWSLRSVLAVHALGNASYSGAGGWLCAALLSIKIAEEPVLTSRYARVVYASALGLAAFVITILLNQPVPDIVYKAF
jgi:PST family polysaccharide transporter